MVYKKIFFCWYPWESRCIHESSPYHEDDIFIISPCDKVHPHDTSTFHRIYNSIIVQLTRKIAHYQCTNAWSVDLQRIGH